MKTKYLYRMAYPDGNLGMVSSIEETKKEAWEYAKGLLEDLWLDSVEIWDANTLKFVMRINRYY